MTIRVKVPEGMLNAIEEAERGNPHFENKDAVEAALRWLSENPIVPTQEQIIECLGPYCQIQKPSTHVVAAIEWQRRMFLEQENEVPEAIIDLLDNWAGTNPKVNAVQRDLIEAYYRGLQSKDKEARVGAVEIENVRKDTKSDDPNYFVQRPSGKF